MRTSRVPKEPPLPAVLLAGVHEAQRQETARAGAESRSAENAEAKTRGAGDPEAPVEPAEAVGPVAPQSLTKGARSHVIKKRKPRKKKDVEAPPAQTPPDPRGLGRSIDVKA